MGVELNKLELKNFLTFLFSLSERVKIKLNLVETIKFIEYLAFVVIKKEKEIGEELKVVLKNILRNTDVLFTYPNFEELRDFYKDIEYLTLTIPEEARSPEEVFEKLRDFSLKSKQWSIEFYG